MRKVFCSKLIVSLSRQYGQQYSTLIFVAWSDEILSYFEGLSLNSVTSAVTSQLFFPLCTFVDPRLPLTAGSIV